MKKSILLLATAAFFMTSCGENKDTTTADAPKTDAPKTDAPITTPAPSTGTELPKFSSPEVQKVAEEYATFMKENVAAAKSGDAAKIKELTDKATEWATKTSTELSKMTQEDAKIWTDYFNKLATELAK